MWRQKDFDEKLIAQPEGVCVKNDLQQTISCTADQFVCFVGCTGGEKQIFTKNEPGAMSAYQICGLRMGRFDGHRRLATASAQKSRKNAVHAIRYRNVPVARSGSDHRSFKISSGLSSTVTASFSPPMNAMTVPLSRSLQ
jgi:hypothetical protein